MDPVTKIALRRIKRNLGKSLSLVSVIFVLMLMISFFVFFSAMVMAFLGSGGYGGLPISNFVDNLLDCMGLAVAFLLLITLITIRSYVGMRREDNRQIIAVLSSVGAVPNQKNGLILAELLILYLPPVFIGTFLGIIPAMLLSERLSGVFYGNAAEFDHSYLLLALAVFFVGMILIVILNMIPDYKLSVIRSVRKQNNKALLERHGYRNSYTFRSMNILKKLAKKSVDYHAAVYRKIAFSFASSVLYPFLGIMLFIYIGRMDIIVDANPYDGIDTFSAVLAIAREVAAFFSGGFAVLTVIGIIQTFSMVRLQNLRRRETEKIYLRVGLAKRDFAEMLRYEYTSVLLRSVITVLLSCIIINTMFASVCA